MATWRYRTSQIYPNYSVDLFGRALIVEVSASKSSVLDFVFATCWWRSGCIEVHIAHFDRERLSTTSQIDLKCSVHHFRQGLGYEGIGGPIKHTQLRFRYVLTPFLLTG